MYFRFSATRKRIYLQTVLFIEDLKEEKMLSLFLNSL